MPSGRIMQPVGQVRFTNVAILRMRRGGIRFEIACYKNKVVNWREGVETNLDEVLQIEQVYTNVQRVGAPRCSVGAQGVVAKQQELEKAFETSDVREVCKLILTKGEIQLGERERDVTMEEINSEIASYIAENCLNPETSTLYTASMIRSAMRTANFITLQDKPPKQQALKCIKQLATVIPIVKCQMKVRASIPSKELSRYVDELHKREIFSAQMTGGGESTFVTLLINPESFRQLEELTVSYSRVGLEILERNVIGEPPVAHPSPVSAAAASPLPPSASASASRASAPATSGTAAPASGPSSRPEGNFICRSCDTGFPTRDEHRSHYKGDWHRYNLKLGQVSQPPISEREFLVLSPAEVDAVLKRYI